MFHIKAAVGGSLKLIVSNKKALSLLYCVNKWLAADENNGWSESLKDFDRELSKKAVPSTAASNRQQLVDACQTVQEPFRTARQSVSIVEGQMFLL